MLLGEGMVNVIRIRAVDMNEHSFRKRALRDACLCIAWIKMVSVMCYVTLFLVLKLNSEGAFVKTLEILLLFGTLPAMLEGCLLFMGAIRENALAISLALYICLLLGVYDCIIGLLGAVHHIIIASNTVHYILTMLFILLAFTLFPVLCHDATIINTYRKMLNDQYNYGN